MTQTVPGPSFDPIAASPEQLAFYGLPERPTSTSDMAEWTDQMRSFHTPRLIPVDGLCASTANSTNFDAGPDLDAADVDPLDFADVADVGLTTPDGASGSTAPVHTTRTSTNWAGYVANGASNYDFVKARVSVPTASQCAGPNDGYGLWVGIGGNSKASGLIQNGIGSGHLSDTPDALTHYAWLEFLSAANQNPPSIITRSAFTANPGQNVTFSTTYVGGADPHADFYFNNASNGDSLALTARGGAFAQYYDGSTAEAIGERPLDANGLLLRNRAHTLTQWSNVFVGRATTSKNLAIRKDSYTRYIMESLDESEKLERPTGVSGEPASFKSSHLSCGAHEAPSS